MLLCVTIKKFPVSFWASPKSHASMQHDPRPSPHCLVLLHAHVNSFFSCNIAHASVLLCPQALHCTTQALCTAAAGAMVSEVALFFAPAARDGEEGDVIGPCPQVPTQHAPALIIQGGLSAWCVSPEGVGIVSDSSALAARGLQVLRPFTPCQPLRGGGIRCWHHMRGGACNSRRIYPTYRVLQN